MRVFVYNLRDNDEKPYFDRFSEEYGIEYGATRSYPRLDNAELAKGYDAICIVYCPMSDELIRRFHDLGVRCIITRSIGVDHINRKLTDELGMPVGSVTYSPSSVANYAIMMMMMCCRKIVQILDRSRVQDFSLTNKMGREISNCTVGVIGTGNIGETVIRHLSGFGCRILACDAWPKESLKGIAEYVDLETLYRESDIITLHVPAIPENYHMINRESLCRMKDGVILINTARGGLVDVDALIDALENKKVGAAALDVLEKEDGLYYYVRSGEVIANRQMAILRSFPNVIMSPHTAFYTDQAVSDMVENSFRYLKSVKL